MSQIKSIEEVFCDLVKTYIPTFELDCNCLECDFLELGFDSLSFIKMIIEIETTFDIEVDDDMLSYEACKNSGILLNYIYDKTGKSVTA